MCIIRRRIALLLGQCASEIKGVFQKDVCVALVGLLGDQDMAVRLAACSSLCYAFRVFGIWEVDLFDCIPTCWEMCFKLAKDAQEFDSKMQVLSFILVLIKYVGGNRIVPFINKISHFFQEIWEESSGECLLQIELLDAIRTFISFLGYNSPLCYGMVLPLLHYVLNVDNPNALNLLEGTLLLFEATLSNAPSIVPQLLDFFPYLVDIANRSLDHLKMFPQDVPPLISGALQKLVFISLCGGNEHYPSRTAACVTSGAILARLLVHNRDFLAQLLSEPALVVSFQQAGISVNQNLLLLLVDMWINKVDDADCMQKKEYAMALSIVLTWNIPGIIERLGDILRLCTSVIIGAHKRTRDDSSNGVTVSSLFLNAGPGYSNTSKESKKAQIRDLDPIRHASLGDMLRENLEACVTLHGDVVFDAIISRIDPVVIAQLQWALKVIV